MTRRILLLHQEHPIRAWYIKQLRKAGYACDYSDSTVDVVAKFMASLQNDRPYALVLLGIDHVRRSDRWLLKFREFESKALETKQHDKTPIIVLTNDPGIGIEDITAWGLDSLASPIGTEEFMTLVRRHIL